MKRTLSYGCLVFVIIGNFAATRESAVQDRFERLWKEKGIQDYTLKGRLVNFGTTTNFLTEVRAGRLTAYKENGKSTPREKAVTVESLLAMASKPAQSGEDVSVRRYDEEYGIPEWIGRGRTDVTDVGGYIEVTDIVPARGGSKPPAPVYPENRLVMDFDGARLLFRRGEKVLLYSLEDRKSVSVVEGHVAGGRAKLAWPDVVWSNLRKKNYFLSARNMEGGTARALTDENRAEAASFLCQGRWAAWRDSAGMISTLNLLDLETGSNRMIAAVSFFGIDGLALLDEGRLFWLEENKVFAREPGKETRRISVEGGLLPCRLLAVDGDDLLILAQKDRDCAQTAGKTIFRCRLSTGLVREVKATLHAPSAFATGDGIVAWVDQRDGIDDVYALSLNDGTERRVSFGTGHQEEVFIKAGKIIWDETRYRYRTLHIHDWKTGKDQVLWTCERPEEPMDRKRP
jgi:hypothetical protein